MPNPRPEPTPDDADTPIRRFTRKRGFWTPLSIGAAGGGTILAVALAAYLLSRGGRRDAAEGPSPLPGPPAHLAPASRDPAETWTHRELTEYLNSKGLRVKQEEGHTVLVSPWVSYSSPRHTPAAKKPAGKSRLDLELAAAEHRVAVLESWVRCSLEPSTRAATDIVGAKGGGGAFSWGRFVFSGGSTGLRVDIRRTLAVR